MSCLTPVREDSRKLTPGFLWTSPYAHFPFANFALYTFTIIIDSHERDYMLSAANAPCESSNLKVVLEIPNMIYKIFKILNYKGNYLYHDTRTSENFFPLEPQVLILNDE